MDITDSASVNKFIKEVNPDAVIHCAAWTAVDAAEDEDKKEKVKLVNVDGTQNIANVCKELDIKMMYISTDYVFNGEGTELGSLIAKTMHLKTFTVRQNSMAN